MRSLRVASSCLYSCDSWFLSFSSRERLRRGCAPAVGLFVAAASCRSPATARPSPLWLWPWVTFDQPGRHVGRHGSPTWVHCRCAEWLGLERRFNFQRRRYRQPAPRARCKPYYSGGRLPVTYCRRYRVYSGNLTPPVTRCAQSAHGRGPGCSCLGPNEPPLGNANIGFCTGGASGTREKMAPGHGYRAVRRILILIPRAACRPPGLSTGAGAAIRWTAPLCRPPVCGSVSEGTSCDDFLAYASGFFFAGHAGKVTLSGSSL